MHIISGDMVMHKRTLDPIKTMVFGLRQYDAQRAQAVAVNVARERRVLEAGGGRSVDGDEDGEEEDGGAKDKQKAHEGKMKAQRRRERKRAMLRAERTHAYNEPGVRMRADSAAGHLGNGMWGEQAEAASQFDVHGYFSFQAKVYLVSARFWLGEEGADVPAGGRERPYGLCAYQLRDVCWYLGELAELCV